MLWKVLIMWITTLEYRLSSSAEWVCNKNDRNGRGDLCEAMGISPCELKDYNPSHPNEKGE